MAAEIKREFGLETECNPGSYGAFEVFADGEMIFSKKECGDRFPHKGEVAGLIDEKLKSG